MKILLVNPGNGDLFTRAAREVGFFNVSSFFAPHSVAAVAAVTPAEHEVVIHDEVVRGPVDALLEDASFDVLGITLTTNQGSRVMEILELCQRRGVKARRVVGGIGAGTMFVRVRPLVDTLFWGEVEDTWPRFLADMVAGRPQDSYQQVAKPDMARTPMPRWELIAGDVGRYGVFSVQTSRGCPFDCSFCDVIYTFGRQLRQKPVERVLDEVRRLERMGVKMVMFADDNFAADRAYVKELLRRLVPLNNSFRLPLSFLTQLDITIARDEELLELLADANFAELQIGIESSSTDALEHLSKRQNLSTDLVAAVHKIQSYGLVVMAHMIIGADSDDSTAFARTARFLDDAHLPHHQCHPLIAPAGTRLWYELKRAGRVVAFSDAMRDRLDITTNVIPKRMTRIELAEGMADYWDTVHSPADYLERALGFLQGIVRAPKVKPAVLANLLGNFGMLLRFVFYVLFKIAPAQRRAVLAVFKATARKSPDLMPRLMRAQGAFLLDERIARHTSAISRAQAAWERAHPEQIRVLPRTTAVSGAVRERMPAIAAKAWRVVRAHVADREAVYRLTLAAVGDYHDRFGAELAEFDDVQSDHLEKSCERVLAGNGHAAATPGEADAPPLDEPPPGFAREILDALDRSVNVAHGGWETADGGSR